MIAKDIAAISFFFETVFVVDKKLKALLFGKTLDNIRFLYRFILYNQLQDNKKFDNSIVNAVYLSIIDLESF